MELGKVTGQVVSTVRATGLSNLTLLLVSLIDANGKVLSADQVAADTLGVGEGEIVLLARGSAARQAINDTTPADLSVVGIVDQITAGRNALYEK